MDGSTRNRVPFTWAVISCVEVNVLLDGPTVVGQDGVHHDGVVVFLDGVIWCRFPDDLGKRAYVSIGQNVVPRRKDCLV